MSTTSPVRRTRAERERLLVRYLVDYLAEHGRTPTRWEVEVACKFGERDLTALLSGLEDRHLVRWSRRQRGIEPGPTILVRNFLEGGSP